MRSLSGTWHGLFSYPSLYEPVFFTATLDHADPFLSGTTEERLAQGPDAGASASATLSGRTQNRTITFLKTYDRHDGSHDSVHYEGTIDPEALEIEGRWHVPMNWSGTFLMVRDGQLGMMLQERWAAKV